MPVNREMMDRMVKEYGAEKGKRVYYAMEMKRRKKKKGMGNGKSSGMVMDMGGKKGGYLYG